MKPVLVRNGRDPRLDLDRDDLALASVCAAPQVGQPPRGLDMGMVASGVGALALGAVTLFAMSGGKPARSAPAPTPAPAVAPAPRQARLITASAPATALAVPVAPAASAADPNQSRANPMIVDNTDPAAGGPTKTADGPGGAAGPATPQLSPDESFSLRIGGGDGVRTRAQPLGDPSSTVVQGAMIPAVLETALNSDLPGYARAIVSRDVRSFDGTRVAIPRGSRLIGQYKSGLSSGQSRAFIVWSRLIRPDGVSIQLGSPVMDEAGATGLAGKVDRHFLQRFGGAMLLSVVSALPGALTGDGSTALVINSGSDSGAAQALQSDGKIAPTIRIPLGTPIQVFVARDLDFAGSPALAPR
jgi:type IV secretion system protein VirB10